MLSSIFNTYQLFLLILIRMSGAILLNPILGRRNIPNLVKAGMTFGLAAALTASTTVAVPTFTSVLDFIFKALIEFAVGYTISMIMNLFLSTILMAAELIDMQMGIGMSKVFDPSSNLSSPVSGSVYNAFFILLFFASDGHITLFKLLSDSVTAIPCGSAIKLSRAALAVAGMMGSALTLSLKFALPIVAIEFISEVGLGVLTRAVPHVNVFSVGVQLKLVVGLLVLVILAPLFGGFCDSLYIKMFTEISGAIRQMM